jgi:electron transfer flavoprotein alpha subunit
MGDVLAFIEHRDGTFRGVAREVVSAAAGVAQGLGGRVHALAVGAPGLSARAGDVQGYGAAGIRIAEHETLSKYEGEVYANVVAEAVRDSGYEAVLFAATAEGRDLAPRVAALLDVPLVTDVTGVRVEGGKVSVSRPVYAGTLIARVELDARPALLSIRPNVFQPAQHESGAQVDAFTPDIRVTPRARLVDFKAAEGGALDVSEATIVVSGGRGMKGPENWHVLEDLRDAIGSEAALGASRAVVDAGWRPHGEQVGQTGKTVSPKLYIAVGISGAIQHLAGMRTAGTIVAVNKDPDAPIFRVADYGIVGDVLDVVPRLAQEIRSLKAGG